MRELANDDKLGSADRGWIKQELNPIERGQRSTIRSPPGKDLAHERGREAAKGYDYRHSNFRRIETCIGRSTSTTISAEQTPSGRYRKERS